MLAVFVEFADRQYNDALWPMADLLEQLDLAEAYVEAQSYGRLDLDYTIVPELVSLPGDVADYSTTTRNFGESLDIIEVGWQAALGAKAQGVDFVARSEQFDSILVITPPTHFFGGLAISRDVPTDDRPRMVPITNPNPADLSVTYDLRPADDPPVLSISLIGAFEHLIGQPEVTQVPWHTTAAHELMHNLGLNDLYPYDREGQVARPRSQESGYFVGSFGRMWVESVWPDTHSSTPGVFAEDTVAYPQAGGPVDPADVLVNRVPWPTEALAWSRWRLGWLDASDVDCLGAGTSTVELGPLADPGSDTVAAMLPLTDRQLLVLEARRRLGYDADRLVREVALEPDQYERLLADEGVLAYVVNAAIGNGRVPISVVGDDGTGFAPHSPVLTVGEGVTLRADADGPVVDVEVTGEVGTAFQVTIDWRAGDRQAGGGPASAYSFDVERRANGQVVSSDAVRPGSDSDAGTITNPQHIPDATTFALDHAYCRLTGPRGFPLDTPGDLTDGTFDVLAMFVDFVDAPHDDEAWAASALAGRVAQIETYLEAQSYGQLDVDITLVPQWVTLGGSVDDYLTEAGNGVMAVGSDVAADAVSLVAAAASDETVDALDGFDVTNDGGGFDSLLVSLPPSRFAGGSLAVSEGSFVVDGDTIASAHAFAGAQLRLSQVSATGAASVARGVVDWQALASWQLLRTLGLRSERDADFAYEPAGAGDEVQSTTFGALGMEVAHITARADANGVPSAGADSPREPTVEHRRAAEMLAWSRWKSGWLGDDAVACLGRGHSRVTLGPIGNPATNHAAVVVPLGRNASLVLEARRRIGYDDDQVLVAQMSVGGVIEPAVVEARLATEGVLAYLVFVDGPALPVPHIGGLSDLVSLMTTSERRWFRLTANGVPLVAVAVTDDDGTNFTIDVAVWWNPPPLSGDTRAVITTPAALRLDDDLTGVFV